MSMDEIFNCLPKNIKDSIIKKFKPEYEKHINTNCTPYLRKYNECLENKRNFLTKSHSSSYLIFKKEINEDTKELIEYDTKVMCKEGYKELENCLDGLFLGVVQGMGDNYKEVRERFYLYLKYDYIKDLKK